MLKETLQLLQDDLVTLKDGIQKPLDPGVMLKVTGQLLQTNMNMFKVDTIILLLIKYSEWVSTMTVVFVDCWKS